ncbi:NPCBM/NEW2 domain-containing protein [Streptomyces sp. NPDC050585]|uniref:NPCBM/NEW2 domain-containing protein n=1 Tax=Streptomyces sp. NPDC050585 TaxID=3365632 RepID=UPI0037A9EC77
MTISARRPGWRRAVVSCVTTAAAMAITASCGGGKPSPDQATRTVTKTPPTVTVTASETSVPTSSPASQSRYLSELEPLTSTQGVDTSAVEINGKGFARSVTLTANAAGPVNSAEYNLGRHWHTFTATVGLRDDSPTGGTLTFEVVIDGTREYRETIRLGESRAVRLDVSDALRLKLTVTYTGHDAGNVYYGSWGDAGLKSSR